MRHPSFSAAFVGLALGVCACAPASNNTEVTTVAAGDPTGSAKAEPPVTKKVDYLVFAPKAYAEELEPLLVLRRAQGHGVQVRFVEDVFAARSKGQPSPEAIKEEIVAVSSLENPPTLKYVLLAGDPRQGPAPVPSFHAKIGDWFPSNFSSQEHRTDFGYSMFDRIPPVAVGRLPARTEQEMTTMVTKLVDYEAPAEAGAWQRRVLVFGGPADFGPVADGLLESQATTLLDQLLPYDYDVGVIFAKADSPYVYRYDKLGSKIIDELNEGSLLAVYAGHGLEETFDRAKYRGNRYPIGSVPELQSGLHITKGAPIFVALTCLTGDYGRESGKRSIAETMMLHADGPVAVFAASDVSHPYANLLYAQALLDSFILQRSETIGDGVMAAKKSMLGRSIPFASLVVPGDHDAIKKEHLTLYNLLGDPASHVRLPKQATVAARESAVTPGQTVHLDIQFAEAPSASIVVTVETERSAVKPGMVPPQEIEAMPIETAFETMAKNYEIASDKVVSKAEGKLAAGKAELTVTAPKTPGKYVAKILVNADGSIASGHAKFEVR